jgi:hypothetical protein
MGKPSKNPTLSQESRKISTSASRYGTDDRITSVEGDKDGRVKREYFGITLIVNC